MVEKTPFFKVGEESGLTPSSNGAKLFRSTLTSESMRLEALIRFLRKTLNVCTLTAIREGHSRSVKRPASVGIASLNTLVAVAKNLRTLVLESVKVLKIEKKPEIEPKF